MRLVNYTHLINTSLVEWDRVCGTYAIITITLPILFFVSNVGTQSLYGNILDSLCTAMPLSASSSVSPLLNHRHFFLPWGRGDCSSCQDHSHSHLQSTVDQREEQSHTHSCSHRFYYCTHSHHDLLIDASNIINQIQQKILFLKSKWRVGNDK